MFPKEFFEKVNFEKSQQNEKLRSKQRVQHADWQQMLRELSGSSVILTFFQVVTECDIYMKFPQFQWKKCNVAIYGTKSMGQLMSFWY